MSVMSVVEITESTDTRQFFLQVSPGFTTIILEILQLLKY